MLRDQIDTVSKLRLELETLKLNQVYGGGVPVPGLPVPGVPVPGVPVPGVPVPGVPVPGLPAGPVPGAPIPGVAPGFLPPGAAIGPPVFTQGPGLPGPAPVPVPAPAPPPPLRNFGEEEASHLPAKIGQMLDQLPRESSGPDIITAVVKAIWDDPEHPENKTITIPDKSNNIPYARKEGEWLMQSEMDLYPRVVDQACMFLDQVRDLPHANSAERVEKISRAFIYEARAKNPSNAPGLLRPVLQQNTQHPAGTFPPYDVPISSYMQ